MQDINIYIKQCQCIIYICYIFHYRYHCLRTKYVCFKKWLMYMKNLYQYESSGLNMKIARRSHFVKEFSKYLKMRDKNKENQNKLFEIVLILFLIIIYRN